MGIITSVPPRPDQDRWVPYFQRTDGLLNLLIIPVHGDVLSCRHLRLRIQSQDYPLTFEQLPFDHHL